MATLPPRLPPPTQVTVLVGPPWDSLSQIALPHNGLCPRRPSCTTKVFPLTHPWWAAPAVLHGSHSAAWRDIACPRCSGLLASIRSQMYGRINKIMKFLELQRVPWTSLDVVRVSYIGESSRPVILWIGVQPESLSAEDGTRVACSCREILIQAGIIRVDVEIRESLAILLKGPKLLKPSDPFSDPTVNIRNPLTTTLGVPIAGKLTSGTEGTGGFFIDEGGDNGRLFLVTARHVLFKVDKENNKTFEYSSSSAPRREVMLLGDAGFITLLESIQAEIKRKVFMIDFLERRLKMLKDMIGTSSAAETEHKETEAGLAKEKKAKETLNAFYHDVSIHWANRDHRVLGHIIYSPPLQLGFGKDQYTRDWAVIEVDRSKIDGTNFEAGNVIDLGTKIAPDVFTASMYPNHKNPHTFSYPVDRLLRLRGTVSRKDMYQTPALDQNGEACLMVVKHGHGSGLTVGRANNICSYVRYYKDGLTGVSKEWPILSMDNKSGPFSTPGDSGAVVADGNGHIGGIITGGAGLTNGIDITYVTSIDCLLEDIKRKFPKAHLNPVLCHRNSCQNSPDFAGCIGEVDEISGPLSNTLVAAFTRDPQMHQHM